MMSESAVAVVTFENETNAEDQQKAYYDFIWQSFIALNWPRMKDGNRGQPDRLVLEQPPGGGLERFALLERVDLDEMAAELRMVMRTETAIIDFVVEFVQSELLYLIAMLKHRSGSVSGRDVNAARGGNR